MKTQLLYALLLLSSSATAQFQHAANLQFSLSNTEYLFYDFDADGDEDLLGVMRPIGNLYDGNEFRWGYYERTDDGTLRDLKVWEVAPDFENVYGVSDHAIADFDGDGVHEFLSIAKAPNDDFRLFWYRPDWGQSLDTTRSILLPSFIGSKYQFIDFDQDGDLDLLDTEIYGTPHRIAMHENIGNFEFDSKVLVIHGMTYAYGDRDMRPVDLDQDGDQDFIYRRPTNSASGQVVEFFRNHDNDSLVHEVLDYGDIPVDDHALADLDNDGDLDLLLLSIYSPEYQRYLVNENGSFTDAQPYLFTGYSIGSQIYGIHDFDLDGDLDLLLESDAYGSNDAPGLLFEQTPQGFVLRDTVVQETYHRLFFGDVSGDGLPDIVEGFSGFSTNVLSPDLTVADAQDLNDGGGFNICYDFDGDGLFDVLGNQKIKFAIDETTFEWSTPAVGPQGEFWRSGNYGFHDLNGDGLVDQLGLFWDIVADSGSQVVLLNDGTGTPYIHQTLPATPFRHSIHDWDDDGDLDFIGQDTQDNYAVYLNDNATFTEGPSVPISGDGWVPEIDDVDGDGRLDLLWLTYNTQERWYLRQLGGGNFADPVLLTLPPDAQSYLRMAQIDGDGRADIVYRGPGHENYWAPALDVPGTFGEGQFLFDAVTNSSSTSIRDVDFNQDGLSEILYVKTNPYYVLVAHNLGEGNFVIDTAFTYSYPAGVYDPVFTCDYDADGDLDLIAQASPIPYRAALYTYDDQEIAMLPRLKSWHFFDINGDGTFDSEDLSLPNLEASVTPDSILRFRSTQGDSVVYLVEPDQLVTLRGQAYPGWTITTEVEHLLQLPIFSDTTLAFGITPTTDEPLLTGDLTSGATRCGFTVPFWVSVQNQGRPFTGAITLHLDSLVNFASANPVPDQTTGQTIRWEVVDLPPFATFQAQAELQMPGVNFMGTTLHFSVSASNNDDFLETLTEYTSVITCAYDPNDKQVAPYYGDDFPAYVLVNDTLDYTIRFQNTGTDTAFTVRLEDQLSDQLDWFALRPVAASHDFTHTVDNEGLLTVLFEDILLPDSTTNLIGSQGFFKFRIPLRAGGALGALENTAEIYFDFNPPIITNTVLSEVVPEIPMTFQVDSTSCAGFSDGQIDVQFPPGAFTFAWSDGASGRHRNQLSAGAYSLTVTDHRGVVVADSSVQVYAPAPLVVTAVSTPATTSEASGTATLTISGGTAPYNVVWQTDPSQQGAMATDLPPGAYAFQITDRNGCLLDGTVEVDELVANGNAEPLLPVRVYPNPTSDDLQLALPPGERVAEIRLIDPLGVSHPIFLTEAQRISLREFPSGTYRLVVRFRSERRGVTLVEVIR